MMSESDKGSEGRGLPVGVEWHYVEGTGGALLRLFKDPDDILAVARADGSWDAWGAGVSRRIRANVHAQRRPDETLLAAAQREAEAALWARDGFEVGEVRGRFVAHGQGFGLPGDWRTKAVRAAPGGHDVDAVRVEAAAGGAPIVEAGPFCEWDLCRAPLSGPPRPGCGSPYQHNADDDEPPPLDAPPAPAAGEELARLLPGLLSTIDFLANDNPGGIAAHTRALRVEAHKDARRACSLLLAERERHLTMIGRLTAELDLERGVNSLSDEAALRARVAEMAASAAEAERKLDDVAALQRTTAADLDAARAQLRTVRAGREDVWRWQGDGRDDPASLSCPVVMSAETLRGLLAAPPPDVAALLAALGEKASEARCEADTQADPSRAMYCDGQAHGLRAARDMVRAHIGGPTSPLARVAAEVMALSPDDDSIYSPAGMSDAYGKIRRLCEEDPEEGDEGIDDMVIARRDLARIARVALAGMLACDAAPVGGAKGGARG